MSIVGVLMKKLYSSVTGIDRGSVQLFSHFEDSGPMWAGSGERQEMAHVFFSEPFKSIPTVFLTLEMVDVNKQHNYRVSILPENITETGFDAVFKTWSDTSIARAVAGWVAIGEVKGDEDWDVDYGS